MLGGIDVATILDYLIPVIAIVVTYIFGRLQSGASYDREQMQLRYNEFYVPFFKQLYLWGLWSNNFSTLSIKTRETIFKVIENNIQHLGMASQEIFPELYESYAKLQLSKPNDPLLVIIKKECNTKIEEFIQAVIEESKDLSNKQKLPELAHTYELRVARSKSKQEQ